MRVKPAVSLFVLVLLCMHDAVVRAEDGAQPQPLAQAAGSWIDPDTPEEARTTEPIFQKPYVAPPQKETATKHKHHKKKTDPPTTSPVPTDAPTSFPTYEPTNTIPESDFELVFSDEFNTPGRTFEDGSDPRWTALEKNDYTNDALHYYSAKNVKTNDQGELVIFSEAADTEFVGYNDRKGKKEYSKKHFRSAMIQGWNKFCFTGGIIEIEATLPGEPDVGGLWPAFWILGNLARHTFVPSSEHLWPWSSNKCTQKSFYAQKINACSKVQHYGLDSGVGRGAPEIDIFEVQPGSIKASTGPFFRSPVGQPFQSASFQAAPGRPTNRPGSGYWPGPGQWYEGLNGGNNSALNILFYGAYNHFKADVNPEKSDYWSDAISYNRQLDKSHFNEPHVYRLEWDVPTNETGGYLKWFLDGELIVSMDGAKITDSSDGEIEISTEPSYIIMNTAISSQWGFPVCPDWCPGKKFNCKSKDPAETCAFDKGFCEMLEEKPEMKVNWVRVYQDKKKPEQKVGCSTPERPTRQYIESRKEKYKETKDLLPLKPIQRGNGVCDPIQAAAAKEGGETSAAATCGGSERGYCNPAAFCQCEDGWTGPHCLSRIGSNPIEWDAPSEIKDLGFHPPAVAPWALIVTLGCLLLGLLVTTIGVGKSRTEGFAPVSDFQH